MKKAASLMSRKRGLKNKKNIIFVAFIILLSITISCNNTIVEPDVEEIAIENRDIGLKQIVTNKDSIEKNVTIINSSKREFRIFMAQKEMTLKTKVKKT